MNNEWTFSISTDINAPAERVYEVMADIERWHEWTPSVTSIKRLDSGRFSAGSRALIRQPKFPSALWTVTAMCFCNSLRLTGTRSCFPLRQPGDFGIWTGRRPLRSIRNRLAVSFLAAVGCAVAFAQQPARDVRFERAPQRLALIIGNEAYPKWPLQNPGNDAKAMAQAFLDKGYKIISGGTDNHLVLVDITNKKITGKDADNRIFKSPAGKLWVKTSDFRKYWKMAIDKAGIRYRNPYQMRHTFISMMLQFGNNPMIIYRMVGHSNPEVMFRKYARFIKNTVEKLLKIE